MAKGFKINNVDFDDIFEPVRDGFDSVTFTGLTPTCSYMKRTGNASNPNADGYWKYNGVAYDALPKGYKIPKSLTVGGSWTNTQYTSAAVDTTGLSFTLTYADGGTESVTPTVSPSTWSSTAGTQTATFSYTENGVTVSDTKDASVVVPSIGIDLGGNPKVFYSISGNLYTNSSCTNAVSTNAKYNQTTFYYKSNETRPSGSYLYIAATGHYSAKRGGMSQYTSLLVWDTLYSLRYYAQTLGDSRYSTWSYCGGMWFRLDNFYSASGSEAGKQYGYLIYSSSF